MKTIEKYIAALLSAILLICVSSAAAYADAPNGVSVSDASLKPGGEFTITLTVPPTENADTASVKLSYDEGAFEVLDWSPVVSGGITNAADGMIILLAANVLRSIDLGPGLTLTAKMRVKDNAPDGEYTFELKEHSFCYVDDTGYNFNEVWFPEETAVTVTVGETAAQTAQAGSATDGEPPATGDMPDNADDTAQADNDEAAAPETGDTAETANAITGEITEFSTVESAPETEAFVDTTRLAETYETVKAPVSSSSAVTQAAAVTTGSSPSFDGSSVVFIVIIVLAVLLTAAFIVVMILTKNKSR